MATVLSDEIRETLIENYPSFVEYIDSTETEEQYEKFLENEEIYHFIFNHARTAAYRLQNDNPQGYIYGFLLLAAIFYRMGYKEGKDGN